MENVYQRIKKSVESYPTMAQAANSIGMSHTSFRRIAIRYSLYRPNMGGKGTNKPRKDVFPLEDILNGKHPQYQTYKLKIRLIRESLIKDECSQCGWNKKIDGREFTTCELDHINGNKHDHRKENLRIICPNCHSLTMSYRFRRGKKQKFAPMA